MRARTSVFIATSLDGYISRTDGSVDWLDEANAVVPEGEDCGYKAFIETVDILVMGRNTFDQVLRFEPWPYENLRVIVLTHRPLGIPSDLAATVSSSSESPVNLVAQLSSKGAKHLYIDGGRTIQNFLKAGLVSQLTITTIPILLGTGRPLFGPLPSDQKLSLIASRSYEFGFVQSTYHVQTDA